MQSIVERYLENRRRGCSARSAYEQARRAIAYEAMLRLTGLDFRVPADIGTHVVNAHGRTFSVQVEYDDYFSTVSDDFKVVRYHTNREEGIGQDGLENLTFTHHSDRYMSLVSVQFTSFEGEYAHLHKAGYSKQVARERIAASLKQWARDYADWVDGTKYSVGVTVSEPELGEESLWGIGLGMDSKENDGYVTETVLELIGQLVRNS